MYYNWACHTMAAAESVSLLKIVCLIIVHDIVCLTQRYKGHNSRYSVTENLKPADGFEGSEPAVK